MPAVMTAMYTEQKQRRRSQDITNRPKLRTSDPSFFAICFLFVCQHPPFRTFLTFLSDVPRSCEQKPDTRSLAIRLSSKIKLAEIIKTGRSPLASSTLFIPLSPSPFPRLDRHSLPFFPNPFPRDYRTSFSFSSSLHTWPGY